MRLIDADKLIDRMYHDAFETDTDMQKWDSGCWIRYKMFENAIDEAPTIEMPQWTPCSERLPKRDGDYLVTFHHKWPDREYKTVEVEKFRSGGFDENLYMKVVAWMPKPKPWEGECND